MPPPNELDVELMLSRPIPEFVRTARKRRERVRRANADRVGAAPANGVGERFRVDHHNVRKSWKSAADLEAEDAARAHQRVTSECGPPRSFPNEIRPTGVRADSSVAQFAMSVGTRKRFVDTEPSADAGAAGDAPDGEDGSSRGQLPQPPPPPPAPPAPPAAAVAVASVHSIALVASETGLMLSDEQFLHLDQSKLPLEMFDSTDFEEKDLAPHEWVACGCGASVPHFEEGEWQWHPCEVKHWDSATCRFAVVLSHNSKTKEVHEILHR